MAKIKRKIKRDADTSLREPLTPEVKRREAEQSKTFLKIVGGIAAALILLFIVLELMP